MEPRQRTGKCASSQLLSQARTLLAANSMMRSSLKFGLWLMGLAALTLWACSNTADGIGAANAGGQGAGGEMVVQGQGGNAAQGGEAGSGGMSKPVCEPRPLGECPSCPKNPDDFDLEKDCGTDPYGGELGVDKYASDCDGVVIEGWGDKHNGVDYYSKSYSFDAQGNLIGYSFGSDIAVECPGIGTVCAPIGEPESLCPPGGTGGQGGSPSGGAGGAASSESQTAGEGGSL